MEAAVERVMQTYGMLVSLNIGSGTRGQGEGLELFER
jgi:hypothetical protein